MLSIRMLWANLFLFASLGLTAEEPTLVVQGKQSGAQGSISWQSQGLAEYRLCAYWDGPRHGMPSRELFELRRSVKGLKVGERLQFYKVSESGTGSASDGGSAVTTPIGEGLCETTYTSPGICYTHRDSPSTLPASAFAQAVLTRTASGATLEIDGVPSPHCGEGYLQFNADPGKIGKIQLTEKDLEQWESLSKSQEGSMAGNSGDGTWTYSRTVTAKLPDLGEVEVEINGYERWIPEGNLESPAKPGNFLRVKARVKATGAGSTSTKARITFKLKEVSTEPGVCLNWPLDRSADGSDLKFIKEENLSLDPGISESEAKSKGLVDEATAVISCFDYGAHGKLQITAVDKDDKPLRVNFQGREMKDVVIPKTDQDSRIADAWKAAKGAEGLPDDWDEAEVLLQDVKGDGLSLYAKYRGLAVVQIGSRNYVRLPPREKAHFVVDAFGVFDTIRWFQSSKIRAYQLDESLLRLPSRVVDFNGKGAKYAVRLEVDDSPAGPREQFAVTAKTGSPRVADQVKLFRGRMNAMLGRVLEKIQKAVAAPNAPENLEEVELLQNACGISLQEAAAALKSVNQAQLLERLVQLAAIHEMGHACGITDGHVKVVLKDGPDEKTGLPSEWLEYEETEQQVGDVLCPMQYLNKVGKRRFILQGVMGGSGMFCSDGFECFRYLTVK